MIAAQDNPDFQEEGEFAATKWLNHRFLDWCHLRKIERDGQTFHVYQCLTSWGGGSTGFWLFSDGLYAISQDWGTHDECLVEVSSHTYEFLADAMECSEFVDDDYGSFGWGIEAVQGLLGFLDSRANCDDEDWY